MQSDKDTIKIKFPSLTLLKVVQMQIIEILITITMLFHYLLNQICNFQNMFLLIVIEKKSISIIIFKTYNKYFRVRIIIIGLIEKSDKYIYYYIEDIISFVLCVDSLRNKKLQVWSIINHIFNFPKLQFLSLCKLLPKIANYVRLRQILCTYIQTFLIFKIIYGE